MDTTLRLNRTRTRWPDGPLKDRPRPAGTRPAIPVPKGGAPCKATYAWIAAIPNPCTPGPRGRPALSAAPGGPLGPAHAPHFPGPIVARIQDALAEIHTGATIVRHARRDRAWRVWSAAPARAHRAAVVRLADDHELVGLKLGVLGAALLVTAVLERLWA